MLQIMTQPTIDPTNPPPPGRRTQDDSSAVNAGDADAAQPRRGFRRWMRPAGHVIGFALVLAAGFVALSQVQWRELPAAPAWQWLALAIAVAGNLLFTGLLFWAVTRSFDADPPSPASEMTLLIAASHLLNYLPLRPGLAGRAAFLKATRGLPLRQSVLVLLVILVLAAGVLGIVGLAIVVAATAASGTAGAAEATADPHHAIVAAQRAGIAAVVGLLLLSPAVGPIAGRLLHRSIWRGWLWIPLRLGDLLISGARLWLVFDMIGQPLPYWQAVAITAGAMLVALTGVTPNGLGLREWVIAGGAALLSPIDGEHALLASLIDRAAEVVVVMGIGLPATVWLRRQWNAVTSRNATQDDPPHKASRDGRPAATDASAD